MKVYESKDIRNVGVVGHGDSGKTTLTAGLLFTAGATSRLLRVDEGNTITDFDEEEIQRKITISTAVAVAEWKKTKLNFLDTPGYNIFISDARGALVAADAALVVVDGVAGVEVQTEKVWGFTEEFKLPRAIVVNKLDRERADFGRALASIQEFFGRIAVPIQLPIGSERDFKGIIDLIRMTAFTYTPDGDGKGQECEIPAACAEEAKTAHEALVEMVAEGNDAYMEEFFEKGTLPVEHILDGLRTWSSRDAHFPGDVRLGHSQYRQRPDYEFRSIDDMPKSTSSGGEITAFVNGTEAHRKVAESDLPSAYVFKTTADPFAGRITYFRVDTGIIKNDVTLLNENKQVPERLAHLSVPHGKTLVPITELHAG